MKNTKLFFLFLWIAEAAFIAITASMMTSGEYIFEDWFFYTLLVTMIISGIFVYFFGLVCWIGTKIRYRKYGEYYVCLYAGLFKNYLIIEDEVQDSACFESYYYGQFPDGTQVVVKASQWDGSIKFAIGDSQNLNLTQF